jgi:hypothetical protein
MDEPKIAAAVEKCVAYANDGEGPLGRAADFLLILRSSDWSSEELVQVQARALAVLGKRFSESRPT